MGIFTAILSGALLYLAYLLHSNKNEIRRLKETVHEQDKLIVSLKQKLQQHEKLLQKFSSADNKSTSQSEKRFIQVIFTPNSKKRYDYLLGNNHDVRVGDFVEVFVSDSEMGKPKRSVAQVVYISEPGEVSEYAKSKIKRKSDYKKW